MRKSIRVICFFSFLFLFNCIDLFSVQDLKPWFGNQLELELKTDYSFRFYKNIQMGEGVVRKPSEDHFLDIAIGISPMPDYHFSIDLTTFSTKEQNFALGHVRGVVRKLWMDDVVGDPISLVTGVSLSAPLKASLRDVSVRYHGDVETELYLAFGKEKARGADWASRWWSVLALGQANVGSPWACLDFNFQKHFENRDQWIGFFMNSLTGFGGQDFSLLTPGLTAGSGSFQGYRSVAHRSVDVGIRHYFHIEVIGKLNLEYGYRVYAKNSPKGVHRGAVTFLYHFSPV